MKSIYTILFADVEYDELLEEELNKCCKIFTHIGMFRTRGYGEIKAELEILEQPQSVATNKDSVCAFEKDEITVYYTISLLESVICQSVAGDSQVSMDYIEGSKLLGSILSKLKADGEDLKNVLEEEFICSNAYIGENGNRYTEVPACYYSIKNNSEIFVDKIYSQDVEKKIVIGNIRQKKKLQKKYLQKKHLQLNRMKHCYIWENHTQQGRFIKQKHVEIGTTTHHIRPEDKGIGHAVKED